MASQDRLLTSEPGSCCAAVRHAAAACAASAAGCSAGVAPPAPSAVRGAGAAVLQPRKCLCRSMRFSLWLDIQRELLVTNGWPPRQRFEQHANHIQLSQ